MTKYERIAFKFVTKAFLLALILCPTAIFLASFIVSLTAVGYSKTIHDLQVLFQEIDILLLTGYLTILAVLLTGIFVLSTWYHNYKWKKFFTMDAITSLKKYDFIFNEEGIEGAYNGVNFNIRYHSWKNTELAFIRLLKKHPMPRRLHKVENHDFGRNCSLINYNDALVIQINVKGKKRKIELDFEKVLDDSIKFAESKHIILLDQEPTA